MALQQIHFKQAFGQFQKIRKKNRKAHSTIMDIIFKDFLILYQNFFPSSETKRDY